MRRERPACGGKKPSSEWFFSSPGWRRHCPSAAGRIPPSPPGNKTARMDGLISCCCNRGIRSRGPQGQNRAGDAILAAGKSCQAGLRGAKHKQADADDRFRIPPLLTALPQCRRANPSFSASLSDQNRYTHLKPLRNQGFQRFCALFFQSVIYRYTRAFQSVRQDLN